jgi:hypothetical protein
LSSKIKLKKMKKIYSLLFIALTSFGFAQGPVLTAVVDGPCPGGYPKICEIYANGTVDFTQFTLQNQTNANTTWTAPGLDLSSFGSKTNTFIYVILTGGNTAIATAEFPSITAANSVENSVVNLNGDDRLRIINTTSGTTIDQFGVSDVDGTGSAWEWLDTYAKRNSGTTPNGTFVIGDWTFAPINTLDTAGTCLTPPAAQLQTIVNIGSYSPTLRLDENTISGLNVYPNPVKDGVLYITTDANAERTVTVFDVVGKQVLNTTTSESAINVANLNSGVYLVQITEEGKTATKKLVIR